MSYFDFDEYDYASLSPSDDPMKDPHSLPPADNTGRVSLSDDDPANFADPQGERLASITHLRHKSQADYQLWGSRARRRAAEALKWAARRLAE